MSQQRITNRKLIILWATVVVAYVLLVVLMNPVLMMPEARQREIFQSVSESICEERATATPEENRPRPPQPHTIAEMRGITRAASDLGVTYRVAYLIFGHGVDAGWPLACED